MTTLLRHILALRADFTAHAATDVVLAQALGALLIRADTKFIEGRRLGVDVGPVTP